MRVAWLNNREFHTQFPPKKLNDWREGRTLILVKQIKLEMVNADHVGVAYNARGRQSLAAR
jgi:hypothetical protein